MLQFAAGAATAGGAHLPASEQAPVCQTLTEEVKLQMCQTANLALLNCDYRVITLATPVMSVGFSEVVR